MTTHKLKIWPEYFEAVLSCKKRFEVRKADRDFRVGDDLLLMEWDPDAEKYTGRTLRKGVTYILKGNNFGVEDGFVVMSLHNPELP
jgi:ASC-1-like (ASCH) protein